MNNVDTYKPDYNLCITAGSQLGLVRSKETRDKISKYRLGKKCTEETKIKMSLAKKSMTEETKDKIRYAVRNRSDVSKAKLSKAKMGHPVSNETKLKISNSLLERNKLKKLITITNLLGIEASS